MAKPVISIEVVSDVVCPWCYIGKRRMEKAVDRLKDHYDFTFTFSPFELNPELPKEGVDQVQYLSKKFGSEERYRQITSYVSQAAAEEGLKFDFTRQKISPNTRDAHRIIRFSHAEGKQGAVKEAFMRAYFEEGTDLSNEENLLAIATGAGLARERVKSLLASGEITEEIVQSEEMNQQRGISGVPFYIINNKYGISGAQPSDTFEKVLKEIGGGLASQDE